ncbi:hypothetical protein GCM10017744_086300 [Streptomyces antimycoticus]|uniref:Uncharacterized protein n=1 Tax=Streptomyces antimycoticus TaxID=68175 RepID=A0A4D4K2X3_9ACTN|nr:hypothetical protein SANT12839_015090 [Streptomyces antimycoticus]
MGNPRPAPDFFADRPAPGFAEAGTVPTLEGAVRPLPRGGTPRDAGPSNSASHLHHGGGPGSHSTAVKGDSTGPPRSVWGAGPAGEPVPRPMRNARRAHRKDVTKPTVRTSSAPGRTAHGLTDPFRAP